MHWFLGLSCQLGITSKDSSLNIPWNVSEVGLVDATEDRTLDAKSLVKSHKKSKFRFRSTPIEAADPVEDAGLRFLRQQLLLD